MKFENIYKETEENHALSIAFSMGTRNHPMRAAINELFDREPYWQNLYSKVLSDGNYHQMKVGKMLNLLSSTNLVLELNILHINIRAEVGKLWLKERALFNIRYWFCKTECFMYPVLVTFMRRTLMP